MPTLFFTRAGNGFVFPTGGSGTIAERGAIGTNGVTELPVTGARKASGLPTDG